MDNGKGKNITVAIYSHTEFYPPVLNAIDELAENFSSVRIISRNLTVSHWEYPVNASLFASGGSISIRASEQASLRWKVASFLRFTRDFLKILSQEKQEWVMCNDPISLFSFRLIRSFLGYRVKLWYHSHDVTELKSLRRFSVGYFAVKSEIRYFHHIDLFTLPSEARLSFFPMDRLKGGWLVVPNYPSIRRMGAGHMASWKAGTDLKLLYQGRVSDEHGLEEIIDYIKIDSTLQLTIIGPGNEAFIQDLRNKASRQDIDGRVSLCSPVPYNELREITLSHQIGLAVNKPLNILYRTAAMASNKIYEYAAAGLPVLYYKSEHYIESLGKYIWAFPTDLSPQNLSAIFLDIRLNYSFLSQAAQADFQKKLNFSIAFKPVLSFISQPTLSVV